ncbi:MAG TPA: low temperature requirement protein A [Micromonosporaceae bacterium]|nr:low temperature requirement protein A [Micromonosporaceae bacterium]
MAQTESRHASWLELFFDLVVVAAIVQLANRLHGEPALPDVAAFLALYLAVWMAWASFTLHANVAGEATRRRAMLLAMFGIAVMAAAIPRATGARAVVFAVAYVAVRILGQRTWTATRSALLAWPSVQNGASLVPWIVSIWVGPPGRYILWGVGLAMDMLLPILIGNRFDTAQAELPAWARRLIDRQEADRRLHTAAEPIEFTVARLDMPHLAERLGLFVIIVLGEAVMQLVGAAAGVKWTGHLVATGVAGFILLIGLWWPTFRYGFVATQGRELSVRAVMPLHFITVASITAIAAGLGTLVAQSESHPETAVRWLLGGGLAAYYLGVVIAAVILRRLRWLFIWGLPCVAAPALVAAFGAALPGVVFVWLLVAVVGWQGSYSWYEARRVRVVQPAAAG